jgi:mRNA-degrading endonuclease RelE of RelBE toxin-antitoxin system
LSYRIAAFGAAKQLEKLPPDYQTLLLKKLVEVSAILPRDEKTYR